MHIWHIILSCIIHVVHTTCLKNNWIIISLRFFAVPRQVPHEASVKPASLCPVYVPALHQRFEVGPQRNTSRQYSSSWQPVQLPHLEEHEKHAMKYWMDETAWRMTDLMKDTEITENCQIISNRLAIGHAPATRKMAALARNSAATAACQRLWWSRTSIWNENTKHIRGSHAITPKVQRHKNRHQKIINVGLV